MIKHETTYYEINRPTPAHSKKVNLGCLEINYSDLKYSVLFKNIGINQLFVIFLISFLL